MVQCNQSLKVHLECFPRHLFLSPDYISLKGFRTVQGEDYKCWPSYSHLGCLLSIHSAEEAAAICNSQLQCQSFIVTQHRTWTGELGQCDRVLLPSSTVP